ncbi:MAG: twin-arginine translocase subunit TatC [Bacteroidales bacterium]|nr:twin-arginine translocase subunit TatC [Bacteroidales bacterium]
MSEQDVQSSGTEMSFWDHLEVLRWALFRIVIALFVLLVGCFIAMPHIFDSFVLGPTRGDFFLYRWIAGMGSGNGGHASTSLIPDFGGDFNVDIININVATQFLTHISTSFWFALVLVFPIIMYEIWKFISPALFPEEQRNVRRAFIFSSLLFYIGCAVGYTVVFPLTFRFLTTYQVGELIVNQISMNSYMSNFLTIVFVMGLVFEMPVLSWILSCLGVLKKPFLKKYRKHAVVILLVLSALITPSGDPFTLSVVFLPLFLLYELSILIVKDEIPEEEGPAAD